jgi:hypothetical protein
MTKRNGLIHRCPQKECGFMEIIGHPEPVAAAGAAVT